MARVDACSRMEKRASGERERAHLTLPSQRPALPPTLTRTQVAQLARANGTEIDESKPYAELW